MQLAGVGGGTVRFPKDDYGQDEDRQAVRGLLRFLPRGPWTDPSGKVGQMRCYCGTVCGVGQR